VRTVRLVVGLGLVMGLLGGPLDAAWSEFNGGAAAAGSISTATVAPPTSLGATCAINRRGSGTVTLTWVPTTSAFATGYELYRSTNGGSSTLLAPIAAASTTTYTDHVVKVTSVTYLLVAVARFTQTTWTSTDSNTVVC